jgi:succinylarginine dihydrolase
MQIYELNVDGLVGPTHHYGGLSLGNLASTANAFSWSNPQAAARQGLAKMRLLHQMGLKQALLPPHQRPNLHLLSQLGFCGTPVQQITKASRQAPKLLSICYSAASMWTANTATVSSSLDTEDQRVHLTAANLVSKLHRYQEADFSSYLLGKLFHDERYFVHHPVLPKSSITADEGAANHSRLCAQHSESAVNLFVYGRCAMNSANKVKGPVKYPARQTLEASQAIARNHQLNPQQVVFACQNPKAIDQGVFHNDVIALANESLLLIHQEALVQQADSLHKLQTAANFPLQIIEISKERMSITDAVNSYFFNSQLITIPNTCEMVLIAATECETNPVIKTLIDELVADSTNSITTVHYLDLKQSMRNGGGPSCLRLRIPLTEQELQVVHQGILVDDALLDSLDSWVMRHYRSQLHANDLADPQLTNECLTALDELSELLQLRAIYPFQREITG